MHTMIVKGMGVNPHYRVSGGKGRGRGRGERRGSGSDFFPSIIIMIKKNKIRMLHSRS